MLQSRYFAARSGRRPPRGHGREVHRRRRDGRVRAAHVHEDDACGRSGPPRGAALDRSTPSRRPPRHRLQLASASTPERSWPPTPKPASDGPGDTVNTAARLEASAEPGEILLGPLTLELVRDAVATEASRSWPFAVARGARGAPTAAITGTESHCAGWIRRWSGEAELAPWPPSIGRRRSRCGLVTVIAQAGMARVGSCPSFWTPSRRGARSSPGDASPTATASPTGRSADPALGSQREDADDHADVRAVALLAASTEMRIAVAGIWSRLSGRGGSRHPRTTSPGPPGEFDSSGRSAPAGRPGRGHPLGGARVAGSHRGLVDWGQGRAMLVVARPARAP